MDTNSENGQPSTLKNRGLGATASRVHPKFPFIASPPGGMSDITFLIGADDQVVRSAGQCAQVEGQVLGIPNAFFENPLPFG